MNDTRYHADIYWDGFWLEDDWRMDHPHIGQVVETADDSIAGRIILLHADEGPFVTVRLTAKTESALLDWMKRNNVRAPIISCDCPA